MEDLKFTYKQYAGYKKCDLFTYYSQFVTESTIETVENKIGKQRILNSTDKYLNDIPLREWNRLQPWLPFNKQLKILADEHDHLSMSPSDYVCIAKTAARIIQNNYKENKNEMPS